MPIIELFSLVTGSPVALRSDHANSLILLLPRDFPRSDVGDGIPTVMMSDINDRPRT